MNFDQPHDDSQHMIDTHWDMCDDSSAAYDAERAAQDASDNEMAERCYQEELAERRAINELFGCRSCGGPLPSERDQEMGTCKPCRVTEGM